MAIRIGGTPGGLPTWGRLRSPITLDNFRYLDRSGTKWTRFSRIWRDSTGDTFPKSFIWESGSLFRCVSWFGPNTIWNSPYYWIQGYEGDEEYPSITDFGMGIFVYGPPDQIDNQDFMELIGEDVDTDGGTFTITQDAHDGGMAWQSITGLYATEIYTIGKLTPI